jgi:hypothetical protein
MKQKNIRPIPLNKSFRYLKLPMKDVAKQNTHEAMSDGRFVIYELLMIDHHITTFDAILYTTNPI